MGLFRSSTPGRPGFRRATLALFLLAGGLACGIFVGLPKLHRAVSINQTPVDMTCVQLLRDGLGESCVVRLTDAVVHEPGNVDALRIDENAPPGLAKIQKLIGHPQAKPLIDRLVQGEVLPRGVVKRSGASPLKLSHGRHVAEVASREVEKQASLLVHVTRDRSNELVNRLAHQLNLELPESLATTSELTHYTLHPVSEMESVQSAWIWTIGSGFAALIGLMLCGSLPLGWWAIFSPVVAIVGLLGLPLRSGRGNKMTWLFYLAVGSAAIFGGNQLVTRLGDLGGVNGNWMWQVAGFACIIVGVAAFSGVLDSIRRRRREDCNLDRFGANIGKKARSHAGPKQRENPDAPTVAPEALKQMIAPPSFARRYLDPRLSVAGDVGLDEEVAKHTQGLEKMEFEAPLVIEIGRGADVSAVTIQVGCSDLALAMTDQLEGVMRLRMISVLEDGHMIVSLNDQYERPTESIDGVSATIRIFKTNAATKMVSKHLEAAADVADRRQTALLTMDSHEWRDIVLASERNVADVLHRADIEKWEIPNESYGRFQFPPAPVEVAQPAG